MSPKVFFVSGVSGVGKTATMKELKQLLPPEHFAIRDFDERGVPDGGGPAWHKNETIHCLDVGTENAKSGRSTIICGFNEPERVRAARNSTHPEVELILLNAGGDVIHERLRRRYPTPESEKEIERAAGVPLEKFIEQCVSYAPTLRSIFEKESCHIIETDAKTPQEVSAAVAQVIQNS